jgi:predicted dehydrogenase
MSDNISVLLIGASQMAIDYLKVLKALGIKYTIVGNSQNGTDLFFEKTQEQAISGGIKNFLKNDVNLNFSHAIVAVGIEALYETTKCVIDAGVKNILVEKPAGLDFTQIQDLNTFNQSRSDIRIAYNRRYYQSVIKAKELILQDGGVQSFHFEFTEWSHVIEKVEKKAGVKDNWFLANSTHVVDLAFYLGGHPAKMKSFSTGQLDWHSKSKFVGSGISDAHALFTYHSNWEAPGRWFAEFLTTQHRFILKPMEELYIQKKGSVQVEKFNLESELDTHYKPGLFLQTQAFINKQFDDLISLEQHTKRLVAFETILKGN